MSWRRDFPPSAFTTDDAHEDQTPFCGPGFLRAISWNSHGPSPMPPEQRHRDLRLAFRPILGPDIFVFTCQRLTVAEVDRSALQLTQRRSGHRARSLSRPTNHSLSPNFCWQAAIPRRPTPDTGGIVVATPMPWRSLKRPQVLEAEYGIDSPAQSPRSAGIVFTADISAPSKLLQIRSGHLSPPWPPPTSPSPGQGATFVVRGFR